jgi:hypothetical protein
MTLLLIIIIFSAAAYRGYYSKELDKLAPRKEGPKFDSDINIIILLQLIGFVYGKQKDDNYQVVRNSAGELAPAKMVGVYILTLLAIGFLTYIIGLLSVTAAFVFFMALFFFSSSHISPQVNTEAGGCLIYILLIPFVVVVCIVFALLVIAFPELKTLDIDRYKVLGLVVFIFYLLFLVPSFKIWTDVKRYNEIES